MEKEEKWMVENYKVVQHIAIGDREVIFGEDETSDMPYMCALVETAGELQLYHDGKAGDDYVEIISLFADHIKEQCRKVLEEQQKVTVKREKITADMCEPTGDKVLVGKVMVVSPNVLRPEYQSCEHQLFYVESGNGTVPNSLGRGCFGKELYSGEKVRWNRTDFLGEIKAEYLPEWAKERVAEIQRTTEEKSAWRNEKAREER